MNTDIIALKTSDTLITECLTNITNLEQIVKRVPLTIKLEEVPPFIINWHDQWEKYGLSYELSTSQLGFNLKNGNYLLSQLDSNSHHYLKSSSTNNSNSTNYSLQSFKLNSCPPSLIKYFRLNLKLKSFLQKNFKRSPLKNPSKKLIIVKKFIKFEFGIIFLLSNNWIQFNCNEDHIKWIFKTDFTKIYGIDSNFNVLYWGFGNSELEGVEGADLMNNQLYLKLKPCVNIFNWIKLNK